MVSPAEILFAVVFLVSGTLLLYFGAEGLVTGSSSMAVRVGITPLVIGLTVVAFGTSSPELVVSISAALKGSGEIALGNVIGSNICNIALILGVAALIRPIKVNLKLIKTDIWLMVVISIMLVIFISDGEISRLDGIFLVVGIIAYNGLTIFMAKRAGNKSAADVFESGVPKKPRNTWVDVLLIIGGMSILVLGANLFLKGAISIAHYLGASEALIGLSVVAFGTSLPELATSMVAAIKKEGDISIGNAIGSNIFNILCVTGFASLIFPISSENISPWDLGVMIFVSIVLFPLAWTQYKLSRLEGFFLIMVYFAYIYYIYLQLPAAG